MIQLDTARAPGTVNNFVVLSRWGWFDDNLFHRVVSGYVIQAGGKPPHDNPGYSIPDELPTSLSAYPKYAVAMANTGSPNSGGGQWFVCIDCSRLPGPNYTVFGQVTEGTEVIDKIHALGQPGVDGPPTKPIELRGVGITG